MLEEQARLAERLGELSSDTSPDLLAFQIHALAQEANLRRELLGVEDAFQQARDALADLLVRTSSTNKRAGRRSSRTRSNPKESS